jgi:fengycin family lipopeptide synthetase D
MVNDIPVQKIHEHVDFEIEYYDASQVTRPFDLSKAPLLRVGLIELRHTPPALRPPLLSGENTPDAFPGLLQQGTYDFQEGEERKYLLMVDMHHIISDGISTEILEKDFIAINAQEELPSLRLQYKDYGEWRQKCLEKDSAAMRQQEDYWLRQFKDEIPVTNMPTDFPRPPVQSFEGSIIYFQVGTEQTQALKQMAQEEETTLYTVLLAIFYVFLSKICHQEDIIVGTDIAGRPHADLDSIIGMFVNTLALRNFPTGEKTFKAFLGEVKQRTLQAFENQEYPFEDLVDKVAGKRDTSRNPLFDVMFALDTITEQLPASPDKKPPGISGMLDESETSASRFDLILAGEDLEKTILLRFEYCTRLFSKETIRRFLKYFQEIIAIVNENINLPLEDINISHDFVDFTTNIFQEDAADF